MRGEATCRRTHSSPRAARLQEVEGVRRSPASPGLSQAGGKQSWQAGQWDYFTICALETGPGVTKLASTGRGCFGALSDSCPLSAGDRFESRTRRWKKHSLFYLSNRILLQERQFRGEQTLAIKSVSHLPLWAPHLHPTSCSWQRAGGASMQGC